MAVVGRISGPLLKANLTRRGLMPNGDDNLAFETDLLYIDVINGRIGINTTSPTHDLTVDGTTRTTYLETTTEAKIATFTISGDTIASSSSTINLEPSGANPVVYQAKVLVDDNLQIFTNSIQTTVTDSDLEIKTNGTGQVNINSNVLVTGDLHATGTITADGNITIGDDNTDGITFNADITSNVLPNTTNFYDLGSPSKEWKTTYTHTVEATSITTANITANGIDLILPQGNILYVATTGKDTNAGLHEHNPLASITHAVTLAQAGDTIYVYPGTYEETFPIEVPNGVTVKGTSLRSVTVKPTASTMYLDAFHMNGEATVEDFTLTKFYHDPTGQAAEFPPGWYGGTGHAFRFSYNCTTTSRSPYIRNVSVLTFGTPSVLSVNGVKTEVIATLNRIRSIIDEIVTNDVITKTPSNPENPVVIIPPSDLSTGIILQGLIDDVVYVINNGTLKTSLPTIVANGTAASTGVLKNAAGILEANRAFIVAEAYAFVETTYPGACDETLTKRDMGLVLDALIYDIVRGGNEHSVYAGIGFWVQPIDDPRGYDRGDAGHGAYVDGGSVSNTSKTAAMLFHSVTFLTPAAETLIVTNGARVEWLNSFTYFAEKGMYLTSGTQGFAGQGRTAIRLNNATGTFSPADTLTYYDTDGVTALATGTISSVDTDNKIWLTGKVTGLVTANLRSAKTLTPVGGAKLSTSVKKFGPSSLALNGTTDYVFIQSNTDFAFGTGDFTLEAEVYLTSLPTNAIIFDFRTVAGQAVPTVGVLADGTFYYYTNGAIQITSTAGTFTTGAWHHVALSKQGTDTRLFLDGVQISSTWTDNTTYIQGPLTLGVNYTHTSFVHGYIDEVRISKNFSRYNANFAQPTAELPNDIRTVLLSHFDGVNNSTTFTDEVILVQDIRSSSGGTATEITLADYAEFGAEVRSIGSACVYGNYGVYGDGLGVTAYLVGQNLAYIGAGKRSDNDIAYVIQPNEIVELNGAHIYYSSVDHKGDFRIGDLFYVNQADGTVQFSTSTFNINSGQGITFTNGSNVTYIDGNEIDTGNIKISGNTVESLVGPLNIVAANDQINLNNNVNITGNLGVTGNVTIAGNIQVGNQTTDTVSFVAEVDSNIIPNLDSQYTLGDSGLQWKEVWTDQVVAGDVKFNTNVITTTGTNEDLDLRANGTGKIVVPNNDVEITNDLTINGLTTLLTDVDITGTVTQTGSVVQTGDYTQTGDTDITGNLTVSTWGQFQDIRVDANVVTTTLTDSDLNLQANGTGRIYVPNNNVEFNQDLTVNGATLLNELEVTNTITANAVTTGDIFIDDNYITTTITDHDLELRANGTGKILVPSNNVEITNDLTVTTGLTSLRDVGITGTVTQTGSVTQTGDYTQTGDMTVTGNLTVSTWSQFQNIRVDGQTIGTTLTNTDLKLEANGTGRIYIPSNDVQIDNNLTVDGTISIGNLEVTNTITTNAITTGDILIDDNYITTTITNHNLELRANGTGKIQVPNNDVQIDQNLTVEKNFTVTTGTTYLKNTGITGTLTHTGDYNQTGNFTSSGLAQITGNVTATGYVQVGQMRFDSNVIATTTTDTDLELRANGTGNVIIEAIKFSNNNIQSVNTNANITLTPQGTGGVVVNSNQSVQIPVGTTLERPSSASNGMIRFNTTLDRYEGYNNGLWLQLSGVIDNSGNTRILAEATPGANDNVLYFYANNNLTTTIDSTKLYTQQFETDNININNNTISAITSNSDVNLTTSGTGGVKIGNLRFHNNVITNTVADSVTTFINTNNGYVKIAGTNAVAIPVGDTGQRPNITFTELGMMRYNTELQYVEVFNGNSWTSVAGTQSGVTFNDATEIGIGIVLSLG